MYSIYVCVLIPIDRYSSRRPSVSLDDATIMTMPVSKKHQRTGTDHLHALRSQILRSWKGDSEETLYYSVLVDVRVERKEKELGALVLRKLAKEEST